MNTAEIQEMCAEHGPYASITYQCAVPSQQVDLPPGYVWIPVPDTAHDPWYPLPGGLWRADAMTRTPAWHPKEALRAAEMTTSTGGPRRPTAPIALLPESERLDAARWLVEHLAENCVSRDSYFMGVAQIIVQEVAQAMKANAHAPTADPPT